ncbi:guanine deaminase [Ideonella sp. DXS29W]|uniref:Guanine deaminase n=1 Tax=Ideonella lacteola TaxID=2984193 RepID=A0ABU9BUF0_9BURK
MTRIALQGDLLDFTSAPSLDDTASPAVRYRPDHWLLIGDDGRISAVQAEPPPADWPRERHPGRLILPGFIDTHVHSAQVDVLGAYGTALLDWLEQHTFPAERRMADPAHAAQISALFLDGLLAAGTTAAMVFPTVHVASVDALFSAAQARGMRLIAGKVLMDRHAPAFLRDDVAQSERDNLDLIARWHGRDRLAYAVTPRFAPTSTDAQLAMAGALMSAAPGLYLQTHVAENTDEVRWVAELFPQARSYLDVYRHFGLLGPRAMLAHGIWLDADDRAMLAHHGASISHCPSSNLFLGSGLFDWAATRHAGAAVTLGTDVGGGTSLSMPRTLADAYQVQALSGRRITAWALLHAATRGAAQALHLGHEIGSLEPGLQADLVVWDRAANPVEARRQSVARDLHDAVFAWLTLGDERHVVSTRVAGVERHRRGLIATDSNDLC